MKYIPFFSYIPGQTLIKHVPPISTLTCVDPVLFPLSRTYIPPGLNLQRRRADIQMGIRKYLATGFTAFDPTNPDRKLMDSSCQAAAESVPASSQTTWFRSVNASVQYSTMHLEQQEVLPLFLCRLDCRGKRSFFVRSQYEFSTLPLLFVQLKPRMPHRKLRYERLAQLNIVNACPLKSGEVFKGQVV